MDEIKKYIWHEEKRSSNLEKHSIDFEDAIIIFEDPFRIERQSDRNGEERYERYRHSLWKYSFGCLCM